MWKRLVWLSMTWLFLYPLEAILVVLARVVIAFEPHHVTLAVYQWAGFVPSVLDLEEAPGPLILSRECCAKRCHFHGGAHGMSARSLGKSVV